MVLAERGIEDVDAVIGLSGKGNVDGVRAWLGNRKQTVDHALAMARALVIAAKRGRAEVVKVLIEEGHASVNAPDPREEDGRTALMWAAAYGHFEVVRVMLKSGRADVDAEDSDGCTALLWAGHYGHIDVMRVLLEEGDADIDHMNKNRDTALTCAVSQNRLEVVDFLLKRGARVRVLSDLKKGTTVLEWAANQGHERYVHMILQNTCADGIFWVNGYASAFLRAVELGRIEMVRLFLEYAFDFGGCDELIRGLILVKAVKHKHIDILRLLVEEAQWDANVVTATDDQIAILVAIQGKHWDLAGLLLREGYGYGDVCKKRVRKTVFKLLRSFGIL